MRAELSTTIYSKIASRAIINISAVECHQEPFSIPSGYRESPTPASAQGASCYSIFRCAFLLCGHLPDFSTTCNSCWSSYIPGYLYCHALSLQFIEHQFFNSPRFCIHFFTNRLLNICYISLASPLFC